MSYFDNEWKQKVERYTKETAQFIEKWMDHLDEKGTALKDKWIDQSRTIDKQNQMLQVLQQKEQLNSQTIQSLQEKLKQATFKSNHTQSEHLTKELKEKNEVVSKLLKHIQAQQKILTEKDANVKILEKTLKESELTVLETEYRLKQSNRLMKQLQTERLNIQKENDRTSKLLKTYKQKLDESTSENTVRHYEYLINTLTDELREATEKTDDIDRMIKLESERNIENEGLLIEEKKRSSKYLEQIESIKSDYEKITLERDQLHKIIENFRSEIDTYTNQLEMNREKQEAQQKEIREIWDWLDEEISHKNSLEIERNTLINKQAELLSEREMTSENLKKSMDLEQRMERGFDKVFNYVKLFKAFYKDYKQLKDPSERMSLEVGLIEMEIAYRMGKPRYRRNVIKTKENHYYECEWGTQIGLPGRIYVRNAGAGCVVERISRVKEGGSRLSQERVIEWLKNQ
jgi:chromosome segregation ATPase